MNWKLILTLSMFGVAMAVASLFGVGLFEFVLWLAIFVLYAVIIAKRAPGKYFLHGFLVSVVNSIWVTAIHATFFSTYVKNDPPDGAGNSSGNESPDHHDCRRSDCRSGDGCRSRTVRCGRVEDLETCLGTDLRGCTRARAASTCFVAWM